MAGEGSMSEAATYILIPVCAVLAILFAAWLWVRVARVKITTDGSKYASNGGAEEGAHNDAEVYKKAAEIQAAISEGATSFLFTEYKYLAYFVAGFSVVIFILLFSERPEHANENVTFFQRFSYTVDSNWLPRELRNAGEVVRRKPTLFNGIFTTIAFIVGALTSCLSGYLGMKIATYANARTALEARSNIAAAFMCAFRSGAVMGFLLSGFALLVLYITIVIYRAIFGSDWHGLFEAITGYGLGGSAIALFGRVGGGIYTKAADVGADLVGKVEKNIPEDDPRNPAVIADNVGDNVGDIAGMGADLFGSFAESTCAALVIASVSELGYAHNFTGVMYPLILSAAGILVCIATTFFATDLAPARRMDQVEFTLKMQLIISTVLMTPVAFIISWVALPSSFVLDYQPVPDRYGQPDDDVREFENVKNWYLFFCCIVGLWGGLIIGLVTEYYTSNRYKPVQEIADSCRTGAATDIIFGLAVGYLSTIVPAFIIATCIFVGYSLAGMYGIAIAALGFLTNMATALAIDAYGPISDNAGGIAEMAEMGKDIRERTDALDAAGNTTAAIGKGFAIGSATLVSLALQGAYIVRGGLGKSAETSLVSPRIFAGLIVGAMLPFWFSAMTMKSVGKAALAMVEEVRRQFRDIDGLMEGRNKPDYKRCVEISTQSALREMIAPGLLVLATPIVVGVICGTRILAGVLAGALISGVQMAVSMSNTGGAWDNTKKFIEAGATEQARALGGKGSDCHKAAVIGDTVGDPLKDTSGPSINILIKLMAVESLVLVPFFNVIFDGEGLVFKWFGNR